MISPEESLWKAVAKCHYHFPLLPSELFYASDWWKKVAQAPDAYNLSNEAFSRNPMFFFVAALRRILQPLTMEQFLQLG